MSIEHGDESKTYFAPDEPVSGGISSGQPSGDIEEEKDERNILVGKFIEANKKYQLVSSSEATPEEIDVAYQEFSQSVEDINGYFVEQNGKPQFENWTAFLEYFKLYSPFISDVSLQCYKEKARPEPIAQSMLTEVALTNIDVSEERKQSLVKIAKRYKYSLFENISKYMDIAIAESTDPIQLAKDVDKLRNRLRIQNLIFRGPGSTFEGAYYNMTQDLSKFPLTKEIFKKIKIDEQPAFDYKSLPDFQNSVHTIGNEIMDIVPTLDDVSKRIKLQQNSEVPITSQEELYSKAMDIFKDDFGIDIRAIVHKCEDEQ